MVFRRKPLDDEAIRAEYEDGDSLAVLAERHGVHPTTIRDRLVEMGVELRVKSRRRRDRPPAFGPSKELDDAAIRAEYERGDSPTVIGARHGVSYWTIRRHLVDIGVELRDHSTSMALHRTKRGDVEGLAAHLELSVASMTAVLRRYGFLDPE